jgi:hypothetical protein
MIVAVISVDETPDNPSALRHMKFESRREKRFAEVGESVIWSRRTRKNHEVDERQRDYNQGHLRNGIRVVTAFSEQAR